MDLEDTVPVNGCAKNNLEDEYKNVQENIAKCSEELNKKIETCREYSEKYGRFISTLLCLERSFIKCEGDEEKQPLISKKIYNQIRTLKLIKKEYEVESMKLKLESIVLESYDEMQQVEVVKHAKTVELIMQIAERRIEEPVGLVMPNCFKNIIYPPIGSEDIKLRKAVYFENYNYEHVFNRKSIDVRYVGKRENGTLYKINTNNSSILCLDKEPDDSTVDLSIYKYIAVVFIFCDVKKSRKQFKKLMEKKFWDKIFVVLNDWKCDMKPKFESQMREKAVTDERLEVIDRQQISKKLFDI